MPTLAELNAQAARTRAFLQRSLEGGTLQRGAVNPVTGATTLLGSSPFTEVGGAVIGAQSRRTSIPGAGVGVPDSRVNVSGPSDLLRSSGSVSRRFNTSGLDRAGNVVARPELDAPSIQLSQADIQPVLEALLATIVEGGGTPQAQAASQTRTGVASELADTVSQLTPEAAQIQSQALVDSIIRETLDEVMPQLQAATESAGASQSALTTLQLNDLAARTAEKAATVAVGAITGFAEAQAGAGAVVERLTATDPLSEELVRLITGTPTESRQASGPLDLLRELGLLPEGLDPASFSSTLGSNNTRSFLG